MVGVIAQRLVRKICIHCQEEYEAPEREKRLLFPYQEERHGQPLTLYRGKGCDLCGGSGYTGRTGLYEILLVDREIRHLINESSSDLAIEDAAIAAGMKTLAMSGRAKVVQGVTTCEEIVRVLGINLGG